MVGYDNTHLASLRHIALTTVDQPRERLGRLAVELVRRRLDAPDGSWRALPAVRRTLEPQLVVRGTTAAPR